MFPKVVYDSWKRSLAYGLDPEKQSVKRLAPEELEARRRKNAVLMEVATSFMEFLHTLVKGSGFVLLLSDSDGYILKLIGDCLLYTSAVQPWAKNELIS